MLGAEKSSCDTPMSLVNATFQWINDNLKDDIDFVIWTGDSARHDNDEDIPRTEHQIVNMNKMAVQKFIEVFGKSDNIDDPDPTNDFVVPIVPTFGNNDILPHNIFEPGPNRWTRDYAEIWRNFIPEAQRHSFARGGWFFTEVIPDKLAVFSLNTIYFFDSNSAVDGCDLKSEPGYEHMEWLRVQLQFLRDRGMKAIMTGHVPPARTANKQSWDETCWQKYSLWMRQYRDVVVGGIFGHMNIDHFMIQDAFELKYELKGELEMQEMEEGNKTDPMFSIESKTDYLTDLRDGWTNLPTPPSGMSYSDFPSESEDEHTSKKGKKSRDSKKEKKKKFLKDIGGKWAERFSLTLVSPSIVPNYYPTLRVVEYNITGLEDSHPAMGESRPASMNLEIQSSDTEGNLQSSDDEYLEEPTLDLLKKKKHNKKKHNKKKPSKTPPFEMPKPPSSTAPTGPAYSPQPLTLMSYTQYFANLTLLNPEYEDSGLTFDEYIGTANSSKGGQEKKFRFEVEYDTKTDKRYQMKDMTVRSYMDLALRIVQEDEKSKVGLERAVLDVLPDGTVVKIQDAEIRDYEESAQEEEDKEDSNLRTGHAEDEVDEQKKGKKHHKKKKGKHGKGKNGGKEKLWHTFVKRAFVMTKGDEDMADFDPKGGGHHKRRNPGT
jgi:endopolyphosphatase